MGAEAMTSDNEP